MEIAYTPEQQAAIDEAIAEAENNTMKFLEYTWSDRIIERGQQVFAVFGRIAREAMLEPELEDDMHGSRFEYAPMIVDGKMLERCPDEGSSGLAHLMRCTRSRGRDVDERWFVTYLQTGWLYTKEIGMSNAEIAERIGEEIDLGAAHITGGRPGWS